MKRVTRAYKQAMNKTLRDHSYMIVTVGVISNEAQATAQITSDSLYLSDNKALFKDNVVAKNYATYEENVFKVDGSMMFPPENTGYQQLAKNIPFISDGVKGSAVIRFDKPYDIKGLTITFGEYYPTEFSVSAGGTTHTYTNEDSVFTCEDSFNAAQTITITPLHFVNGDNKRLRIESMVMGIGIVFQNDDIENASFTDNASFISEELPQMDFSITCYDRNKRFRVDDNNSFINYLAAGQKISVSMGIEVDGGSIEWVKLPLTYMSSWSSNNEKVSFSSVDRFAFLTGVYSGGNTIHERTLYDDAIAVLTDAGLEPDEYEVSDYLRTINVVNPLPEVSHAECLQLIANAGCCLLKQDDKGSILILPNFENIVEPNDLTLSAKCEAPWSNLESVKTGATTVYADYSPHFFAVDGSMYFMPEDTSEVLDSGYVSDVQSDDYNRLYVSNSKITDLLPSDFQWVDGNKSNASASISVDTDGSLILTSESDASNQLVYTCAVDIPIETSQQYLGTLYTLNAGFGEGAENVCELEILIADSTATLLHSGTTITNNNDVTFPMTNYRNPTTAIIKLKTKIIDGVNEHAGTYRIRPSFIRTDMRYTPSVTLTLPTAYTYYGINLKFATPMTEFTIKTYEENTLVDTLTVTSDDPDYEQTLFQINHPFYSFDKMTIEFQKTFYPHQRVILQQISFGKLSEYDLHKQDMLENPIGTVEPKTQTVSVKVFTFHNSEQEGEQPQALDDNVYSVFTVGSTGNNVTFENQLISTQEHATTVARWIANYYANNITYEVNYRGEPRIDAADYLFMDSDVLDNLQVEVESHVINFSGALSGTLNLRRAINLVGD